MKHKINPKRIRKLNERNKKEGDVIYWMSREQRVDDNWGLITAINAAETSGGSLIIVFVFSFDYPTSTWRRNDFLLKGLLDVEKRASELGIKFEIWAGLDEKGFAGKLEEEKDLAGVITDFNPMRNPRKWRDFLASNLEVPLWEVDGHNVTPAWVLSDKEEYAARTIRSKVHKSMPEFLDSFPKLEILESEKEKLGRVREENEKTRAQIIKLIERAPKKSLVKVSPQTWQEPGYFAGMTNFGFFLEEKIQDYEALRNDPNANATSCMSAYIRFGHVSAQRLALETQEILQTTKSPQIKEGAEGFFEEAIVRRELAENYVFYNENYDTPQGYKDWAKTTLEQHKDDPREYIYELEELENAKTHDELWNAAQKEMLKTGKMQGYLRMYWAKKILEWTESIEVAHKYAIYLNDKYQLDGDDPNGFTGVAWSIGGIHDRAWFERDVFGKIRYMNYNGAKRKFDVGEYVVRWG